MRVQTRWSLGFLAVHLRYGDRHTFRAIAMRCNVKVNDVFRCFVPGPSVPIVTVVSDVVCAG